MGLERTSASGSAVEILDRVLDKGIVIDAAVRLSVVGIEVLGVDARIVVASFETYMRHADAIAVTGLAAAPATTATIPTTGQPTLAGERVALPAADALLPRADSPTPRTETPPGGALRAEPLLDPVTPDAPRVEPPRARPGDPDSPPLESGPDPAGPVPT